VPDFIDLHCHSTASDGSLSPTELLRLAKANEVSVLALTDHDTVAGVPEAAAEAGRLGIEFLPGIEISCEFPQPGTLHLLGYGVDPESGDLKELTRQLIEGRDNRNPRMIARLNELGVAVTMKEWEDEAGGKVVGRPHLAAVLIRKGYASSTKHAFDKYLGHGASAYVDKERLTPRRAIELIQQSKGIAVLAHPVQLRTENDAQLDQIVKNLVDQGLQGMEIMHSDQNADMTRRYTQLADRYHLLKTGGSDFHGFSKKDIGLGWVNGHRVPGELYTQLKARLGRPRI
jgi:predicted metal-dependent phosphoesterase TrpH